MSLDKATDLLFKAHQNALITASGYDFSGATLSPVAAGLMEVEIRNRLRRSMIDAFHLTPDFQDNPFGWLHTRLDPVVESIKENQGKFIGAVAFFHAVNMVGLMSALKETQRDVMLGDQNAIDKWLPFVDNLWSLVEGVVNLSGILLRSEYAQALGVNLSSAGGRVSVALSGLRGIEVISKTLKAFARKLIKYLPYIGPVMSLILEGRTAWRAWHTGHDVAVVLAGVQIGLTIGIGSLIALAVMGTVTAPIVLVGAVLIAIATAVTAIQIYIARSRIEDFLSLSFWGNARTLRYWDDQPRLSNEELLEISKSIVMLGEASDVKRYFEKELDAFYYLLFSPIVKINEYMSKHPAITRQGEYKVLPELTRFYIFLPGFNPATCATSVRVFEAKKNIIFKDECKEITHLFDAGKKHGHSGSQQVYEFTHYNHNNCEQLELLIEYVKDGRKITGDDGLRIILDGNDVEELGVNERLTFEL